MLPIARTERNAKAVAEMWGKDLSAKNDWFKIEAKSDDTADLLIYDVIGWPFVTADELVRSLAQSKAKTINVRINSPGGDVADGTAIYNALKDHPAKIVTQIDGLAASMASIIALAGDERRMASNAYYMIHNPWAIAMGDYRDFEKTHDLLVKVGDTLARTYAEHAKAGIRQIKTWMDDETWMTASEAKSQGFIDEIGGSGEQAKIPRQVFSNAPEPPVRDLERTLREAGLTQSQAKAEIRKQREVARAMEAIDNTLNTYKR